MGGRKAEADVAYDPALADSPDDGTPGAGGSDLGEKAGDAPDPYEKKP